MANDVASRNLKQADSISIVVHLPERRRQRAGVPVQAGDCCSCCCCCCLHTVGSLIGAVMGAKQSPDTVANDMPAAGPSAASIFWWTVLVLIVVVTILGATFARGIPLGGLFISLMALPLLQLLASFVTGVILGASRRPDADRQFKQLGKMTLGVVAGTFFGGLAVGVLFLVVCGRGF